MDMGTPSGYRDHYHDSRLGEIIEGPLSFWIREVWQAVGYGDRELAIADAVPIE